MSRRVEDQLGASLDAASAIFNRPARKQAARPALYDDAAGGDYNIWYHKKMGTHEPRRGPRGSKALTKLVISTDAGRTRADVGGVRQFCIYFARGCCTLGPHCTYLHRAPNQQDAEILARDLSQDCFGRTRAKDGMDDRQGVGSAERDCRTLYIFYGGAGGEPVSLLRELLAESFGEFGSIENINIIPAKTIAFVRYYWRASAEFAKEAMHAQTLKGSTSGEVLNVCWANDDPNPTVIRQIKRDRLVAFDEAQQQMLESLPEDQKRARIHQEQMLVSGAYPDTDAQYDEAWQLQKEWTNAAVAWHFHGKAMQQAPQEQQPYQPGPQPAGGMEDDIDRYCADDPYYDLEPEEAGVAMDPRAGTDYSHGQAGASSRHVPPEDAAAGLAPPSAEELGNQDNGAGDGAAGEARQGDESVGGALAMLSGYDTDDSSGQD